MSEDIRNAISAYRARKGIDRNDLLRNRGVLFQKLAADAGLYRALGRIDFRVGMSVCDIGGGSGGSLVSFMELGCPASTLTSLDILSENVVAGRERFPGVRFDLSTGEKTPYEDDSFDVVYASTIFSPMVDDHMARSIGQEMRRIVRQNGHIVIRDWNIGNPWDASIKSLTKKRLHRIFDLPLAFSETGALAPPLGRPLSRYAPWAYFVVRTMFPVGQRIYVMKAG